MAAFDGTATDCAILAEGLRKSYGNQTVIDGLSLHVPLGKIYGLLGPSGCGKTTLLKCVVGRLEPDAGLIRVLGQRPGKLGHRVPGSLIGYMPQDLALYQEFSISETLFYFGRIFGMNSNDIEARVDFLVGLLKLPDKHKLISRLSGGQQRRVSFACALLHKPPLMILDEPTVGVDPLLRQCIWQHLKDIVNNPEQPTSVVITTHYIEEAREGHLVALMRDGRLLAEASPASLLSIYRETVNTSGTGWPEASDSYLSRRILSILNPLLRPVLQSLEAVFLKLCHNSDGAKAAPSSGTPLSESKQTITDQLAPVFKYAHTADATVDYREAVPLSESLKSFLACPKPGRVAAMVLKDFRNMRRRFGFLLFQFSLPVVQIVLFCLCIGRDPAGLRLAVVNQDATGNLGADLLKSLDTAKIKKVPFSSLERAKEEVLSAGAWAVLHLEWNFTVSLTQRMTMIGTVGNSTISQGSIHMYMDESSYQVSAVLKQCISLAFENMFGDVLESRRLHRNLAKIPIAYHEPLLGNRDATFTEFMAPGIIVTILFFLSTGLTAVSFVVQRKEGLLDRSLVAGVTVTELMLGHVLTELVIMSGQTALLLLFSLVVFGIRCSGSVALVILLALVSGFGGMSLGLLISVLCSVETAAMQAALGTMYPSLLLSGIMWPSEAMPDAVWYISRVMPTTLPVEAMRSIFGRGFGLTETSVWMGLVSSICWSTFLLLTAALLIRLRGI